MTIICLIDLLPEISLKDPPNEEQKPLKIDGKNDISFWIFWAYFQGLLL